MVSNKYFYIHDNAQKCVMLMLWPTSNWLNVLHCIVLPVIELLWSSPGIHLSLTLLLLCSESCKTSGASGTSENHPNYIGFGQITVKISSGKKMCLRELVFNEITPSVRESEPSCITAWYCGCFFLCKIAPNSDCQTQHGMYVQALLWVPDILIHLWTCQTLM